MHAKNASSCCFATIGPVLSLDLFTVNLSNMAAGSQKLESIFTLYDLKVSHVQQSSLAIPSTQLNSTRLRLLDPTVQPAPATPLSTPA